MAYEVPESTIRSAWEAGPRSQGVAYPDYKAQWLAANPGAKISSGGGGGGGGGTGGAPDYGESAVFWNALTELPGANVGTYESDGSIDYYTQESARIQAALDSEAVSPERKRALRDQQAQLDAEYRPQRVEDATSTLQNAGSDADALKALQALEGIGREGGVPSGGSSGGTAARSAGGLPPDVTRGPDGQLIGPNGLPAFDPTDEAQLRREFEANGGERGYGYSFDEYKRYVAEANPNGEIRYTSETAKNLDGRPKTYPGYSRLGQGLESTGQTGMSQAEIQRAANLGYFDNITGRAISDLERKNQSTDVGVQAALDQLDASRQNTRATTEGYTQGLFDEAARTNSVSQASTRRLTGATNQYNASNLAALDAYKSGIAPYQTEIAGTTRQNVAFDPEGLAAQRRALGMGQDIYGGSLDYQSQAARAYADPEDVKRAQEGLRQLHAQTAAGGGGIEQTRNLEHAREQLRTGGDEQRKILDLALDELANGGDRQREVYDRYKGLSTPEMTAAERAILAQSQRQFAIHDKASRDATRADLEERGILSGAGAIAGQQAARQQLGEERVAGTLGAQAQSVGRAMQALEGMGVTANALRAGDQGALGIAHSAADSLRTGEQNALQLEQAAANALREGNIVAAQAYTAAAQRQREQGWPARITSRRVCKAPAYTRTRPTRSGPPMTRSTCSIMSSRA